MVEWKNNMKTQNSLFVINPYFDDSLKSWVFDDPDRGLHKEALVQGADLLCEMLHQKYGDFSASFSAGEIPNADLIMCRTTEGDYEAGTWYKERHTGMDAWLCPALFQYFDDAPATIYVKVNRKFEK